MRHRSWVLSSFGALITNLRYADHKFSAAQKELEGSNRAGGRRRATSGADYHARGVLFVPEIARYSYLLNLPEGQDIGRAINESMKTIEAENEELRGVLPKDYNRLETDILVTLLKTFSAIPMDIEGDVFGKIYEYFPGQVRHGRGASASMPKEYGWLMHVPSGSMATPTHGSSWDPYPWHDAPQEQ